MRVKPLGTIKGLATGLGHPTPGMTRCWTPSLNMEFHLGGWTSWEYAGHRNPEDKEEVTSSKSGVARKLYQLQGGSWESIHCLGRGGDIQVNSAVFVFHGCLCLRGLSRLRFQTRSKQGCSPPHCVEKLIFHFTFNVILVEMVCIQYKYYSLI